MQEVCLSHSDAGWNLVAVRRTAWEEKGGGDLGLGTCHSDPANPRVQKSQEKVGL